MLDCARNIIGINHCLYKKPYLKDLGTQAGINIRALDEVADEDQINFLNVLEDIKSRGIDRVASYLIENGIVFSASQTVQCFGDIDINYTTAVSGGGDCGILFSLEDSKFGITRINNVIFYSPINQTITFFIKDLIFNNVLVSSSQNLSVGVNVLPITLDINPRNTSGKILIGYNQIGAEYYNTLPRSCSTSTLANCSCYTPCTSSTSSIVGHPVNLTTYGLSVDYSTLCSFEKLFCDNQEIFSMSILYATCIEFIYERLGSNRLNSFTLLRDDNFDKLLQNYESLFSKSLNGILKSFNFNDNNCFKCRDYTYVRYSSI